MNRIAGFRKMTGLTQKEIASKLNISEGTYRNKEKGKANFKDIEMKNFFELVQKELPSITISNIFFNYEPTQTDVYKCGKSEKTGGEVMICTNCGAHIKVNDRYYRAGKAGTVFHSEDCCHEAYEGYYTPREVEKTITRHTRL